MQVIEQLEGFRLGDKGEVWLPKADGWNRAKAEALGRHVGDAFNRGYEQGLEEGREECEDDDEDDDE